MSASPAGPARPAEAPVSLVAPYVSPRRRTRALVALLAGVALCLWFAVGFDVAELRLLARTAAGEEVGELERRAHAMIRGALAPLRAALLLGTFVAYVSWIHLVRRNLRALGARRMHHSTRAAVWSCLVPGVNLWRPYRVLREVWRASDPEQRDPFAWRRIRVPWLLPAWWAALLAFASAAALALATSATAGADPSRRGLALGCELAADLAGAVAASLGYLVAVSVARRQEDRHRS